MSLLQLTNISVEYDGIHALKNVSLSFEAEKITALMGPNGAGKSTVLKALFGLTKYSRGSISFQQNEIQPVPYEMIERGVVFVPQGRRIFPQLSVEDNLLMGGLGLSSELLYERYQQMYALFPALKPKRKHLAKTLSGGQQQMVAMGRALMTQPKILLLDEPTLGLSPKMVHEVFDAILKMNRELQLTVVVVEHNLKSLFSIIDHCIVLARGEVVIDGSPAEVLKNSTVQDVLLGIKT